MLTDLLDFLALLKCINSKTDFAIQPKKLDFLRPAYHPYSDIIQ